MSTREAVSAVEELAAELLLQDGLPVQPMDQAKRDAISALLAAFDVSEAKVAGFACVAGRPLLVIHQVGKPYLNDEGARVCETEVRAIG